MSLDILNPDKLKELVGEGVYKMKVKEETKTTYKFDSKFEKAMKAIFTGDYTFETTLEEFLDEMSIKPDDKQKKLLLKKLKDDMKNVIIGDEYIEDEQEREAKIATLCESAISDACAEIDGYLAKRYRVPFTKTPQVINKFAKDISVYNLVSRTGIDESDREKTFLNRYNAAIKFLLDVAKGIISIGVEEKGGSSEAANGFKMKSSGRVFSRDSMRGW